YAVEGEVDGGFVVGFLHPGVKGVAEGLAFVLDGEVDQRGGAAKGGGGGAGLEIVGAGSAAEGHVEMGVDVDAAWEQEEIVGIDDLGGVLGRELRGDGGDFFAVDTEVDSGGVGGGDDGAVLDDGVEAHLTGPQLK